MVFSHRPVGFADGAALFPVYRWDLIKSLKPSNARRLQDKVAAGLNPAAHATLAYEGIAVDPTLVVDDVSQRLLWSEARCRDAGDRQQADHPGAVPAIWREELEHALVG